MPTTIDVASNLARGIAVDVRYLGEKMAPEDQAALLTMLRNVRLFLTPERSDENAHAPVDNPSFG